MVKLIAAGVSVLVFGACASSISIPVASATPSSPASDSPAANLRVQVDLLLGEHTFMLTKLAVAAAAGQQTEYRAYAGAIAANGSALTLLLSTALGPSAGGEFGHAWATGNSLYVDYIVAAVTHDQPKADAATSGLNTTFVPSLARVLGTSLSMPEDQTSQQATSRVSALKAVIDDSVAAAGSHLYADLMAAHTIDSTFGDTLARKISQQFTDRYPGDSTQNAVEFRVGFGSLLQRQAFMFTMASDAVVAGSVDLAAAARAALSAGADAMVALYGGRYGQAAAGQLASFWKGEIPLIPAYATSGDPAVRQQILGGAALTTGNGSNFTAAFRALMQVVDDQRAKAFDKLAADDRAAGAEFAAVAD